MPVARFSLPAFLDDASLIAARVSASVFRGVLTRSLTLPEPLTALAAAEDGSRRVFEGGSVVDLDGADTLLLVKAEPIEPVFEFIGLPDRDGVPTDVQFRLRVRAGGHESDLAAVEARLIPAGAQEAQRAALRAPLGPPVTDAVRAFLSGRSAGDLLDTPGAGEALAAAVLPAAAAALFSVGFEAVALEQAAFDSPAWREKAVIRERTRRATAEIELREEIDRRRREGQLARVEHLEKLAERLKALRGQFPDSSLETLLRKLDLEQAGLSGDLAAGLFPHVQPCRRLYVAAGASVLVFEPPRWTRPVEKLDMPAELGAARSVRIVGLDHGRRELAVGCRLGVYLLPLEGGPARSFCLGAATGRREPRGGINSVAAADGLLFASHSEIGLTAWRAAEPDRDAAIVETGYGPVSAVRAVCTQERLGAAVTWGNRVLRFAPESLTPPTADRPAYRITALDGSPGSAEELLTGDAEITALLPVGDHLIAGDASGRLRRRRASSAGAAEELERGAHKVYGLAHAVLGGVGRVLIADNGYAVRARALEGAGELQYRGSRSPVCFVAGSSDYVFALDAGQTRIYVWNSDDPSAPAAETPVRALVQHSAVDLAVLADATAEGRE